MQFLVLILLMLMLPMRSGMGEAMAAPGSHHGTTHQQQAGLLASAAHGLEDCAGHGADPAAHEVRLADANCDACSACQTCHAMGLAFSPADVSSLPAPNAQPEGLSIAFVSAPAAHDQKPPIS